MIRAVFVVGALALGVTSVVAEGNVIEQRQSSRMLRKEFELTTCG